METGFSHRETLNTAQSQGEWKKVPSLEERNIEEFVDVSLKPPQFVLYPGRQIFLPHAKFISKNL